MGLQSKEDKFLGNGKASMAGLVAPEKIKLGLKEKADKFEDAPEKIKLGLKEKADKFEDMTQPSTLNDGLSQGVESVSATQNSNGQPLNFFQKYKMPILIGGGVLVVGILGLIAFGGTSSSN